MSAGVLRNRGGVDWVRHMAAHNCQERAPLLRRRLGACTTATTTSSLSAKRLFGEWLETLPEAWDAGA